MVSLRMSVVVGVAVCLAAVVLRAQDGAVFKDVAAEAFIRDSRAAIGQGEGRVLGLHTLLLRGRSRVVLGDQPAVDAAVEIKVLLPDRYVRTDVAAASRLVTGFSGNDLLTSAEDSSGVSLPPANLHAGLVKVEQARLARLLLGMAAYVSTRYFVTFRSGAGVLQMSQVQASASSAVGRLAPNTIEGAGRDGFFVRISVDGSRFPARIEYLARKNSVNVIEFSDRRDVDGLRLPFRIRTMDGGRTIDDLTLEQIAVNLPLSDSDFPIPRR